MRQTEAVQMVCRAQTTHSRPKAVWKKSFLYDVAGNLKHETSANENPFNSSH